MSPSPLAARILRSNVAGACIALFLVAVLLGRALAAFPGQPGIDFYQFWGVPVAKAVSAMRVTPYVDPSAYAQVLNGMSDASESQKLHDANIKRRTLEPMGTPLLYATFALFPGDYDRAQTLFAFLQYLATGVAVFILARLRGAARWPAVWIALLVELTFVPFLHDVRVGNVNSLQLLFIAVLLHVAVRRLYSGNTLIDGVFIGTLSVFVIFKPNTPWIALAFALHYWAVHGHRRFWTGAGLAAVLGIAALGIGAWYFGDVRAWAQWLEFARGMDGSALPLTLAQGNLSFGMILAQHSRWLGPMGFGLLIGMALAAALHLAMSGGRKSELQLRTMRALFSDPWLAVTLGIVFTLATSPLVWPHYLMLTLVPIFWLARIDGHADLGTLGALGCYLLLSLPVISLLGDKQLYAAVQAAMLCSWVALVPGVLARATPQNRALQAAAR